MRGSLLGSLATLGLLAFVAAGPAAAQTHHDYDDDHGRVRSHSRRHDDGHRRQTLGHTVTDLLRYGTTNSHSSRSHYYRDHYDDRGYDRGYRTYRSSRGRAYGNGRYSRERYYEPYRSSRYDSYRYDSYERCD